MSATQLFKLEQKFLLTGRMFSSNGTLGLKCMICMGDEEKQGHECRATVQVKSSFLFAGQVFASDVHW